MSLSHRLEIRQSHALVMTPQLMQAIKLLQLSNLDLAAYVENELEKNPLLERSSDGEEEDRRAPEREQQSPGESAPAEWPDSDRAGDAQATGDPGDVDGGSGDDSDGPRANAETLPSGSEWCGVGAGRREDGDYNLEAFVSVE